MSKILNLQSSNPSFDFFIKEQESNPRCGKLKLRDWLLTIVQRCPRYLLLLKDIINNTETDDPEYSSLLVAQSVLLKGEFYMQYM